MPLPGLRALFVLALSASMLAGSGCGKSNAPVGPDGGCSPACDATNQVCIDKVCESAAAEGSPCGTSVTDGGPSDCLSGLVCDLVSGGAAVCSLNCTAPGDCDGGTCYARPTGAVNMGYCAYPVAVGGKCNDQALLQCTPSMPNQLVNCISNTGGDGTCFQRCGTGLSCPSGQDCTAAFSDMLGVCAPSTDAGSQCNEQQLAFCTGNQECIVEGANGAGICHLPCDTTSPMCPSTQSCVPLDACNPSVAICVVGRIGGQLCDPSYDDFCGNDSDCVNLSGELLCEPDCTSGQTCDAGSCHVLPLADGGAGCRKACF